MNFATMENVIETELINTIKFYNKYIKEKHFSNNKLENVLADCLFRYIHLWEVIKEKEEQKMIDCIKQFNNSDECKSRFDEIKDIIILPEFNETNKLLLIKCVYYENLYELN